ncbi:MAG: hypothetical protein GXX99_04570 [Clostridiales bacterium]|nr:hypothetical protein [Clostridiales bacterium]
MVNREQRLYDTFLGRYVFLGVCVVLFALLYAGRLANLQIVNGEEYRRQTERRIYREVPVPAPRGGIYDRHGRALVVNRMGFSVVLDAYLLPKDTQNDILLSLLALLDGEELAFADALPLTLPPYAFLPDAEDSTLQAERLKKLLERKGLQEESTPEQIMARLIKDYDLGDYSPREQRILAGLRYEMEQRDFSALNAFTFGTGVDVAKVTAIKERQEFYQGVDIVVVPMRAYTTGLAAHILGRVGPIYKGQAAEYLEKGYQLSDTVGIDGIEKSMEEVLRGVSGSRMVEQSIFGKVTDVAVREEPRSGDNVLLSIDSTLQSAAETALAETIAAIAARGKATGKGTGYDAAVGSVVVIEVNTGQILAMASYPSYDLRSFNARYADMLQDPDRPLFNRAISGAYAPGSVFKMVSAVTGLESGTIDTKTIIVDRGVYTYYAPYLPRCWIYTDYGSTHGPQNVIQALQNSCNYFFYETGRLTDIDPLVHWATAFGLGQRTGVELTGEVEGMVAGPEEREQMARRWYNGDTIQAYIGQSDHLYTPIQLCNYIATIANGGTRYQPTLIRGVTDYRGGGRLKLAEPVVLEQLSVSPETLRAVQQGMRSVAEVGTASSVFRDYPVQVAGKTGTASVPSGTANGVFACYAPFESPEIAIVAVIEHGGSGNATAPVARAILDAYFGGKDAQDGAGQSEMELLG